MTESKVMKCPHCGKELNMDEIFTTQMKDRLESEVGIEIQKRMKETENDLKVRYDKLMADRLAEATARSNEENARLSKTLESMEKLMVERTKELDLMIEEQVKLKEQLSSAKNEAKKELAEQYDEMYKKAVEEASESKEDEILILKKKLADAEKATDELKRKIDQGSQQLQGEVREIRLEEELKVEFPMDVIEEVDKGKLGADIIQTVVDRKGKICGRIVWECKNVKTWKNEFIPKLRDDVELAKGDVGILVSSVFGRNMAEFTLEGGVWLITPGNSVAIGRMIRDGIIRVKEARAISERKENVKDEVYAFVTSSAFRNRIENIGRQYMMLDQEITKTKNDMDKHFSAQRKLIDGLVENTQGILGEVSTFMIGPEDDKKLLE